MYENYLSTSYLVLSRQHLKHRCLAYQLSTQFNGKHHLNIIIHIVLYVDIITSAVYTSLNLRSWLWNGIFQLSFEGKLFTNSLNPNFYKCFLACGFTLGQDKLIFSPEKLMKVFIKIFHSSTVGNSSDSGTKFPLKYFRRQLVTVALNFPSNTLGVK